MNAEVNSRDSGSRMHSKSSRTRAIDSSILSSSWHKASASLAGVRRSGGLEDTLGRSAEVRLYCTERAQQIEDVRHQTAPVLVQREPGTRMLPGLDPLGE